MDNNPNAPTLFEFVRRDDFVAREFGESAMLTRMIDFEIALADVLERVGLIPEPTASAAKENIKEFVPDMELIRECTARDGVPVPELVRQLREVAGEECSACLHLGATSQDLIDTALVLALKSVNSHFASLGKKLDLAFERMESEFGLGEVMARTRMQNAEPMLAKFRIKSWRRPLLSQLVRLESLRSRLEALQFGGPTGDRSRLGHESSEVSRQLASALGIRDPGHAWHAERGTLAEYAAWNATLAGILGKFGLDMALMAQMGEISLAHAGSSSSMPHKSNPIRAELLVSLARFSGTLVSGCHQALVHEQERSGSAWMLEWMLLPQICEATGASLNCAVSLANSVQHFGHSSKI